MNSAIHSEFWPSVWLVTQTLSSTNFCITTFQKRLRYIFAIHWTPFYHAFGINLRCPAMNCFMRHLFAVPFPHTVFFSDIFPQIIRRSFWPFVLHAFYTSFRWIILITICAILWAFGRPTCAFGFLITISRNLFGTFFLPSTWYDLVFIRALFFLNQPRIRHEQTVDWHLFFFVVFFLSTNLLVPFIVYFSCDDFNRFPFKVFYKLSFHSPPMLQYALFLSTIGSPPPVFVRRLFSARPPTCSSHFIGPCALIISRSPFLHYCLNIYLLATVVWWGFTWHGFPNTLTSLLCTSLN